MKIGIISRLITTYAFWRALGAKDRNSALAVVHEGGFASITSGNLSLDVDSEHITVNVIYSDYGEYTMAVTKPDSEPDHVSRMFG
jgi:hypothetical protein